MYTLKIESDNGFCYVNLPKKFKFNFNSKNFYISEHMLNLRPYLVDVIVRNPNENNYKIEKDKSEEGVLIYVFLQKFKDIEYFSENGERCKIFFNGDAYLVKEGGRTIEKF